MFAFRRSLASLFGKNVSQPTTARRHRGSGRLRMEVLEDRSLLATFTVINTLDSGAGSFRDAITQANSTVGVDTIAFSIAGTGVKTIAPTSALPFLTVSIAAGHTFPSTFLYG